MQHNIYLSNSINNHQLDPYWNKSNMIDNNYESKQSYNESNHLAEHEIYQISDEPIWSNDEFSNKIDQLKSVYISENEIKVCFFLYC